MNSIDVFLRKHEVDVGRTFAICSFLSAATRSFDVIGALLSGRISIDLSIPIGIALGIALWRHRPWARTLMVVISWLVAAILVGVEACVIFGIGDTAIFFGSTVIRHPTGFQAIVFGVLAVPVIYACLGALVSGKAKEEFGEQSPKPEFRPANL